MDRSNPAPIDARLRVALAAPSPSDRLQAALSAGTRPNPGFVDALVERCAIEPDFYVRDMLTWSLLRHPTEITVPRLMDEVERGRGQARSQAIHSLSKIRAPAGWAALTEEVLADPDDDVARTAWRAAVLLVPAGAEEALARTLSAHLGRGSRDLRMSLSRSLASLGETATPAVRDAASRGDGAVRMHAIATERMIEDPEEGFDTAIFEAERIVILAQDPPSEPLGRSEGTDD